MDTDSWESAEWSVIATNKNGTGGLNERVLEVGADDASVGFYRVRIR